MPRVIGQVPLTIYIIFAESSLPLSNIGLVRNPPQAIGCIFLLCGNRDMEGVARAYLVRAGS